MRFTKLFWGDDFIVQRAVLYLENLTPSHPPIQWPHSPPNSLYLALSTPFSFTALPTVPHPHPNRLTTPQSLDPRPPLLGYLWAMQASLSPSKILPKRTARRSFENNSPDFCRIFKLICSEKFCCFVVTFTMVFLWATIIDWNWTLYCYKKIVCA